jgi:hypothetical protein
MSGDFLGINLSDFAIGMQGGWSGVLLLPNVKAKDVLKHGLAGGFVGNYAGPWLSDVIGTPHMLTCWAIGVAGMASLHVIIAVVESRNPEKRLRND